MYSQVRFQFLNGAEPVCAPCKGLQHLYLTFGTLASLLCLLIAEARFAFRERIVEQGDGRHEVRSVGIAVCEGLQNLYLHLHARFLGGIL